VLRLLGADVIVTQEIERGAWRGRFVDQPRFLARMIGADVAFCRAWGRLAHSFGCAVFSRFPVVERSCVKLPRLGGEQRVAVVTRILGPSATEWSIVGTHLGLTPEDRSLQIGKLLEVLGGLPPPVVLAGDLNAVPGSPELAGLEKWGKMAGPAGMLTYPSDRPSRRIDYVFAGPGCDIIGARTVSTPASDHLPLVAALSKQETHGGES
jgi:endonuclease/exonuclease/phosphatase family metal-dependent hydrolase